MSSLFGSNGSVAVAADKKEAKKRYKEEMKRLKEQEKQVKLAKKKEEKEKKKRGKGFVGHEIGLPTNFSHDTHVGWDMERGFEANPPLLLEAFHLKSRALHNLGLYIIGEKHSCRMEEVVCGGWCQEE